jgi:hypothetical protein
MRLRRLGISPDNDWLDSPGSTDECERILSMPRVQRLPAIAFGPQLVVDGEGQLISWNSPGTPWSPPAPGPVAAIRLTMNALSSAGAKVTETLLQAGIG